MGCGQLLLEAHRESSSPQKAPNCRSGEKRRLWWDTGAEAAMQRCQLGALSLMPTSEHPMPTSAAVGGGMQGHGLQLVPSATAGRKAVAAGSGSWKEFFTWEFEQKRLNEVKNACHTMKAEKEHFQTSPASSAPRTQSRSSQLPPLLPTVFWGFMAPHHRGELCLGSEVTTTWRDIMAWCPHLLPSIPPLPWLSGKLPTEPTRPSIATGRFQHLPAGRGFLLLRSQPWPRGALGCKG